MYLLPTTTFPTLGQEDWNHGAGVQGGFSMSPETKFKNSATGVVQSLKVTCSPRSQSLRWTQEHTMSRIEEPYGAEPESGATWARPCRVET